MRRLLIQTFGFLVLLILSSSLVAQQPPAEPAPPKPTTPAEPTPPTDPVPPKPADPVPKPVDPVPPKPADPVPPKPTDPTDPVPPKPVDPVPPNPKEPTDPPAPPKPTVPTTPKATEDTTGLEIPTTFRTQVVVDKRSDDKNFRNRTNKLHCFVCENDLNPTVAVFVRTIPKDKDNPLARLAVALNTLASEDKVKGDNFGTFIVFLALKKEFHLDDDRDIAAKEVKEFGDAVATPAVPLGLAAKTSEQVTAWKIGDDDITVVYYHRHKEVKRWTFSGEKPDAAEISNIISTVKTNLGLK